MNADPTTNSGCIKPLRSMRFLNKRSGLAARAGLAVVLTVICSTGLAQGFIGVLHPHEEWSLSTAVSGLVEQVTVEVGDQVEAGQTLLQLEADSERLEAQRRKLIWESEAESLSLRARLEILEVLYQNAKILFDESGSVSREDLARLELDLLSQRGRLEELEVEQQRQHLEWQFAEAEVEQRKLRAPGQGVITAVSLGVGEWAQPEQPAILMVDASQLEFRVNLPHQSVTGLVESDPVWIDLATGPAVGGSVQTILGHVSYIAPVLDAGSGLLELRAQIDNPQGRFRPGLQASLRANEEGLVLVADSDPES